MKSMKFILQVSCFRGSVGQAPSLSTYRKSGLRAGILVLAGLFSLAVAPAQADKIVLLGDSLGAAHKIPWESGWAQLLAEELSDRHELINASVSGETTGGGMARLQGLLDQHQPQWVIVELGGNDGLRGYPLKVIRNNLKQLDNIAAKADVRLIYLGIQIPPNYGQRYNDAFTAIFEEVAAETGAPYLSLFIEEIAENPEMMLEDKLHPSELAQPIIKDHVANFIEPILAKKDINHLKKSR